MKAIANKIIVKDPVEEKTSAGGIIIQEKTNKNTPIEVEIVAVGSTVKELCVGNKILISPYTGTKFCRDEINYRVLLEEDVLVLL